MGDGEEEGRRRVALVVEKERALAFPGERWSGRYRRVLSRHHHGFDTPTGGSLGLVAHHKARLRCALEDLLFSHQWGHAAGVLSVLLRAVSTEDRWRPENYRLYWAALEVTRQIEGFQGNDLKYRRIYKILYEKQPKDATTRDKTYEGAVGLEQALYLMVRRHFDNAQLLSGRFMDVPPYRDHAVANVIHGLALHHLWEELVMQDLQQNMEIEVTNNLVKKETVLEEGVGETEDFTENLLLHVKEESFDNQEEEKVSQKSVQVAEGLSEIKFERSFEENLQKKACSTGNNHMHQGFYNEFEEEEEKGYLQTAFIPCSSDMDERLFPVSLPQTLWGKPYNIPMFSARVKGPYTSAVKHLRQALAQAPHLVLALLPLVQLLLAVADVEGAYKEIERCCQASDHVFSFRIRLMLVNALHPKNYDMIAWSFEELLKRDPSSTDAIESLISLHNIGRYNSVSLAKFIACYLDVSKGYTHFWQRLAQCFVQLKMAETNYMGDVDFENETTLKELIGGDDKVWSFRLKWWKSKHFNTKCEWDVKVQGTLEHLVFKAACAAHMLGPAYNYVSDAHLLLKTKEQYRLAAVLEEHMDNSLNLFSYSGFDT